jgi:hypothetical protein
MLKRANICVGLCLLIGSSITVTAASAGGVMLDHFAFSPQGSDTAANFYVKNATGALTTSADGCFTAGVQLPNGATVTKVTVWYKKNSANSARFALRWRQFSNGRSEALVDEFLPGSAGLPRTSVTFDVPAASGAATPAYSYGALVCLGTNDLFWGARIHYTDAR